MKHQFPLGTTIKYTPEIVTYSDGEPVEGVLTGVCHIGNKVRITLANGKELLVDADRVSEPKPA